MAAWSLPRFQGSYRERRAAGFFSEQGEGMQPVGNPELLVGLAWARCPLSPVPEALWVLGTPMGSPGAVQSSQSRSLLMEHSA